MSFKLDKLENFHGRPGPLVLIIMDGIGIGKQDDSNAVYKANTPVLDSLMKGPLYTQLKAHGPAVGLPSEDDMGNSEVGHNAIGAGRVFAQGAKLVNAAIETGKIFETPLWKKILDTDKTNNTVHFIGLLSDGNVHSHINQLIALLNNCAKNNVHNVRVHILLDGRDVPGKSALIYIEQLERVLQSINQREGFSYKIASGGGRMITTMDRYNADWSVVKRGWDAHVLGNARHFKSAAEAVQTMYNEDPNMIDQYMESFVIVDDNDKPFGTIQDNDAVIFFNFRGDRAIELSRAFEEKDFKEFDRVRVPNVLYAGMMEYDGDLHIPKNYLVLPPEIDRTLSEYLVCEKVKCLAISETQKYGHVTYFWNGNKSGYIDEHFEKFIEIPSDRIQFDKAPKMKAVEITDETIRLMRTGEFKFIRLNYPNGDMVGHTGNFDAAVIAVETTDQCVGRVLEVVKELNGIALITADHGNADEMYTITKGVKIPKTSHTLNPVPFIIYDPQYKGEYKMADVKAPGLTNIASTILNLLGYKKVEDYDPSLIEVK
ncbi:MAG TPA: 2,3-bisphosphoglycerate-independent phosphoglycerate mutase [Ignavibacteriaceae bacterium]|nr:2,3-bisphosphoglycerate-independent phosphoglycerate mutase [Ignavibacteriaceae bacterium]